MLAAIFLAGFAVGDLPETVAEAKEDLARWPKYAAQSLGSWALSNGVPEDVRKFAQQQLQAQGQLSKKARALIPSIRPNADRRIQAILKEHFGKLFPKSKFEGKAAPLYFSENASLDDCRLTPSKAQTLELQCRTDFCISNCFEQRVHYRLKISVQKWRLVEASQDAGDEHHGCGICYLEF